MKITYRASPTLKVMHKLRPLVLAIRGPIGSGKSVGCVMHMLRVAMEQEPNSEGVRKTRWVCVRNTYPELKGTVIKTFQQWIPEGLCPIIYDAPIHGTLNLPGYDKDGNPDGTTIESEFYFLSLDKPKDVQRLMSLETTGVWINEAQFLDKALVLEALSRCGRYPMMLDGGPTWYGLIMDTNSPDEDHWWHEYEFGVDEAGNSLTPRDWVFIEQPGGLLEITSIPEAALSKDVQAMIKAGMVIEYMGKRFVANPKAENHENHKKGFGYWLEKVSGQSINWIRSRLCNKFATVLHGKPVYQDEFNRDIHVSKDKLLPVKGWSVFVGVDFGLTPAAIIGQISPTGQLRILDEVISESMGIKRFAEGQLVPLLNSKYAGMPVTVWGDPAGVGRAQTDEKTCFEILAECGLDAEACDTNNLTGRLEAVRFWLGKLVGRGLPALLISPTCKVIIRGFEGGYAYRQLNVSGETRYTAEPDKNRFSHPHDALQYLARAAMPSNLREQLPTTINAFKPLNSATGY